MKKLLMTAAAIGLLATPAVAGDFDGPYAGIALQYAWGEVDVEYEDGTTGLGDFSESESMNGLEGGLFAGYRHLFDSGFVLGGEVGYQISGADGDRNVTFGANTAKYKFEKDKQLYIDLKPGYVFQDNMLGYALIGYQRTEFEEEALINGASLGTSDDNFNAWRFGVGVEYMMDNNFSVRGQYYYAAYSEEDYNYVNGQSLSYDADESVFQVGLSYNF
jgi:outer membrane immunogenic protein